MSHASVTTVAVLATGLFASLAMGQASRPATWPAAWADAWAKPSADLRPMQILHSIPPQQATPEAMSALSQTGLGGIVCNVSFKDYLNSPANWETLVKVLKACREAGLVVWIYDEKGYPSGAAGGEVLKANPEFEATALAYDPTAREPFIIRRAYEHTHASNNFAAAQRYVNLLDGQAIRCFIDRTHQAYWQHLEGEFGTTIRAFFTDEPSLMPVNLGQLGEDVRKRVPVVDPVDEKVKPLPSVPWVRDLPDRYHERYGQDLIAVRKSLFEGDSADDRTVRRRFWSLVADLVADRYFGQIQQWCRAHRVASSGHNLWEEEVMHHVGLYGNGLKALMRMDIPGMDMLSSDPMVPTYSGWMSALLPASAALFNGGRRVMTEVSDFSQTMGGQGPASLAMMQATAAWQAAFGVTEFTSYYGSIGRIVKTIDVKEHPSDRNETRAYCDFIGRMNALLRASQPDPSVLLYYPIYDLWSAYRPVAQPLKLETQSPQGQKIVRSFNEMGRKLTTSQIAFALVDHDLLGSAQVDAAGLAIKGRRFKALVLPVGVELPEAARGVVDRFVAGGGCVMRHGDSAGPSAFAGDRLAAIQRTGRIEPPCGQVVLGRFARDGRRILLLVNVGTAAYAGQVHVEEKGDWTLADPATGAVRPVSGKATGRIDVSMPARSACLLVGPA